MDPRPTLISVHSIYTMLSETLALTSYIMLKRSISCVSNPSSSCHIFYVYNFYHWTNHNRSTTSLKNSGLNKCLLVRTIIVIFFVCWRVCSCSFCVWHFWTNTSLNQRWSTRFNTFMLTLKFGIFARNFKISFAVFISIDFLCLYNHCYLSYSTPRRNPVVSIWLHYNGTWTRALDPSILIQYVNVREPMVSELWSHRLDGLCRDVHPTAQVYIPPGTER